MIEVQALIEKTRAGLQTVGNENKEEHSIEEEAHQTL
jgi:hypothetical protein